ncbi:G-protein coupled receptor 15-like [Acipenser ruthenus]|uniref:G-protein coupled receptor 15-like n=1 Tax=Acipenser ruthenus TaxID=7906 RepID=UPI002741EEFB|nr:G-protein coupled receptor 15-like [Acipenser ruthenus]XP_058877746.1 G-protein coupled receptor 15-like [Acipenser ruthenus]
MDEYYDYSYSGDYPNASSSYSPAEEIYCDVPHLPWGWIVRCILYCVVLSLGVPGNMLLMGALWVRHRFHWRPVELFMINLAFSDLLFLLVLPLWLDSEISGGRWRTGWFSCLASSYTASLNMHAGIFFLTAMSVDRYLAVVRSDIYRRITHVYNKNLISAACCVSVLLALPVLFEREHVKTDDSWYCRNADPSQRRLVSPLLGSAAFFLPLLIILFCYCCITKTLCHHYHRTLTQDKKLRRSFRIVFLVVAVFVFSWVPFNAFKLLAVVEEMSLRRSCLATKVAQLGLQVTVPLAFANSCANPVIYACTDASLRQAALKGFCPRLHAVFETGSVSRTSDNSVPQSQLSWRDRDRQGNSISLVQLRG